MTSNQGVSATTEVKALYGFISGSRIMLIITNMAG